MAASVLFEINPGTGTYGAPGVAANAAPSAVVVCRVASTTGLKAETLTWSNFGTHAAAQAQLVPVLGGSPVGQTATFTLPATATGQAYGIQLQGRDGEGNLLTAKSAVYCLNASARRPFFVGESFEGAATHATVERFNAMAAWPFTGGVYQTPTLLTHASSVYAILSTDSMLLCDVVAGVLGCTLGPVAANAGRRITVLDWTGHAAANNITIGVTDSTVNGAATVVINTNYGGCELYCDGVVWRTLVASV